MRRIELPFMIDHAAFDIVHFTECHDMSPIASSTPRQIAPFFDGADRVFRADSGARLTRIDELADQTYYVAATSALVRCNYPIPDPEQRSIRLPW